MRQSLEGYMPTEAPVYRATDIDFEQWAREGVKAIVWDVEGTLGQRGAEELDAGVVKVIAHAREAGVPYHALVTNKSANTKNGHMLLDGWQQQTGADAVFWPEKREWRKPNPCMPLQAMAEFDLTPRQMGAVGDKATADMASAYRAGFGHRAWTRAIEGNEHPGDVLIRRPIEVGLRLLAHLQMSPTFEAIISTGQKDGKPANVQLPENPTELHKFLYEHGRDVASALTYSRILLASGVAATGISSLEPDTKRAIAAGFLSLQKAFWQC